ncbi:hypothetical protein PRUPE_4G229200 [Prunus persica]|uniref:Fatty acid desaturase domain-containing protein n=1 Tax=Prunus persica TaxID=3760 RepID=M5WJM4_PRUPE|nr:hypothetical protein PRUPE_4G229200 [Prunus persica]
MGLLGKVLRKSCGEFWGRKWNIQDVFTVAVFLALYSLCAFAPFHFNWPAFWVAITLYVATGLGIRLCYHRSLLHTEFQASKMARGSPIERVSTHRYHHQFTDTGKDPHSPIKVLWYSHMGWILNSRHCFEQPFYRFLGRTKFLHPIALGGLLYVVGGFPFLVWGMVGGIVCAWRRLANNHHAFEYSARHGLEWWQIDFTWYIIRFLQAIGAATNVKVPTEIQKQRKSFK